MKLLIFAILSLFLLAPKSQADCLSILTNLSSEKNEKLLTAFKERVALESTIDVPMPEFKETHNFVSQSVDSFIKRLQLELENEPNKTVANKIQQFGLQHYSYELKAKKILLDLLAQAKVWGQELEAQEFPYVSTLEFIDFTSEIFELSLTQLEYRYDSCSDLLRRAEEVQKRFLTKNFRISSFIKKLGSSVLIIPTSSSLTLMDFIKVRSEGIFFLGVSNKIEKFDGIEAGPFSYFWHDISHTESQLSRDSRTSTERLKKAKADAKIIISEIIKITDPDLKQAVELLAFHRTHETFGYINESYDEYSVDDVLRSIRIYDLKATARLKSKLKAGVVWLNKLISQL